MAKLIFVAFHFRIPGDPLDLKGNRHQACYKEFDQDKNAVNWLRLRAAKTKTSPQGQFVTVICADWDFKRLRKHFVDGVIQHPVVDTVYVGPLAPWCENLHRGIKAYLHWKSLFNTV